MADHSRIFGSDLPVASDKIGSNVVDSQVDNFADDISQRLTLDHYMDGVLSGSGDQDGRHRRLTLKEISSPTALENAGILFSKESDSVTELFYEDDLSAGNETQITKDSVLNIGDVILSLDLSYSLAAKITGTIGTSTWTTISVNSGSTYSLTTVPYPDGGFNKDNSSIIASQITQNNSMTNNQDYIINACQKESNAKREIKSRSFGLAFMQFLTPVGDGIYERMINENKNSGYPNHIGCDVIFTSTGINIYASPLFSGGAYTLIVGKLV